MAHPNDIRLADVGDLGIAGADPEHGDIEGGISADDRRRHRLTTWACDGEVVVGLHRVTGGDDQARAPVDAGRRDARPAVNGHHRASGLLNRAREFVRKQEQPVHAIPS